jgi:hypothetical protein
VPDRPAPPAPMPDWSEACLTGPRRRAPAAAIPEAGARGTGNVSALGHRRAVARRLCCSWAAPPVGCPDATRRDATRPAPLGSGPARPGGPPRLARPARPGPHGVRCRAPGGGDPRGGRARGPGSSRGRGVRVPPCDGCACRWAVPAIGLPACPAPLAARHTHVSPLRHPDPRVAHRPPARPIGWVQLVCEVGAGRPDIHRIPRNVGAVCDGANTWRGQVRAVGPYGGVRCQQRGGRVPGDAGCRRKRCPPAPRHGREASEGDSGYARGMCSCCDAALTFCALFLLRNRQIATYSE